MKRYSYMLRRSISVARLLLPVAMFAVAAFGQAPWQNAAQNVDTWFTSTWGILGGLVILIAGFQMVFGSGHAKMAALVELVIGLGLIKYHSSLPAIF